MGQITLYYGKKDHDLIELARLRGIRMSELFIKALYKELGVDNNTDLKRLVAEERVRKKKKELERAELMLRKLEERD